MCGGTVDFNSVLCFALHSISSITDLEGEGTQLLVDMASNGVLAMRYSFLPIAPADLLVGQVDTLQSEYKALVLTYEALKEGIRHKNPSIVSRCMEK